jgi:hypothetical protein
MAENLLEMKSGGLKFKNRVSNPRVFRAYMLAKAPVLGVTGAALDHIDTYGARLSLHFGRRTKSLFGTMFGAAVLAGAETTSGAMLVLHMRNQGAKLSADLVEVQMKVLHNSTEDLTILCHEGERYADFVQAVKASGSPSTQVFEAHAVNRAGTITHTISLTWRLS